MEAEDLAKRVRDACLEASFKPTRMRGYRAYVRRGVGK